MRTLRTLLTVLFLTLLMLVVLSSGNVLSAGEDEPLISDERFLLTSAYNSFNVESFLRDRQSGLLNARVSHNGEDFAVAEVIMFYAQYYSINPEVLIGILELRTGLVRSSQIPEAQALDNALGFVEGKGFVSQIEQLSEALVSAYYARQDGSVLVNAPNSSTYALRQVIAKFREVNTPEVYT